MKRHSIFLNAENENRIDYLAEQLRQGGSNAAKRREMRAILRKAIDGSLTEMQRGCLTAYYAGVPQKVIAQHLGLSNSTVCRHIKAAEGKLRKIADYYS